MTKAIIRAVCVALGELIMTSHAIAIRKRLKKHLGTIGHCDVTIASDELIYLWRHNRSTVVYFEIVSATWGGKNVDLRQLSDRNHINDLCTEYTELEMYGGCFERSARHLGFSRDSRYILIFVYNKAGNTVITQ